jgi:cytochrome c551/c552
MRTFLTLLIVFAALGRAQDHALLDRYCIGCHNEKTRTAGFAIDKLDFEHPGNNAEAWEKAIRKIRSGMMPPAGMPRPDRATLNDFATKLELALDRAAEVPARCFRRTIQAKVSITSRMR